MKIEVETGQLAEATRFVVRTLPRAPALPALAGLLVTASPATGLTVTGYDVDSSSTVTVPATVSAAGRALLPGRPLADVLGTLPAGLASITAADDTIGLATDEVEFCFPTVRIEDFPGLPALPPQLCTVAGRELQRAVAQVAPVTGRDSVPPMLTAIRCEFAADELRLAATDRYRLALRSVPYVSAPTAVGTTLLAPAHLLSAAASALDAGVDWTLGCTSVQFAVGDGSRQSVMRLLDASYPTIERLVPTEFACTLRVERDALLAATRRVTLADEQRAHGAAVLDVRADQVMVSSGSGPSRGRQRLVARAEGSPVRVAFTAAYLAAALQALDGEVAVLGLNPGVGKVLVSADGVDSYRHVLMSRQLPP